MHSRISRRSRPLESFVDEENRMADFIAGKTSTTAILNSIYGSQSGSVDFIGDSDWFRVFLQAGYGYQVWVEGSYFGNGTLYNPYLGIYSGNGFEGRRNRSSPHPERHKDFRDQPILRSASGLWAKAVACRAMTFGPRDRRSESKKFPPERDRLLSERQVGRSLGAKGSAAGLPPPWRGRRQLSKRRSCGPRLARPSQHSI